MAIGGQIRRLLVTWLVLLTLVACSARGAGPTATVAPPPPSTGRALLILWHAWPPPEDRALAALVARFNRTTPGVQVVLQSRPVASLRDDLTMAMAEGGGPHMAIIPSHTLGALVSDSALKSAEAMLPPSDAARLLPTAVGSARVPLAGEETLFGVPLTFDTLALYYNRANFPGAPPNDTDALLAVARGLAEPQSDPPIWGLAYNLSLDRTIAYLYAFGGRIFDEQGAVTLGLDGRAGAEAWLTWLMTLREDPRLLASMDGVTVDSALSTQQALMTIDWAHAVGTYNAIWPGNLGVAPLPRLTVGGSAPKPFVQSDLLVFNARLGEGAEQAGAAAFSRFLVDEAAQRDLLRAGRQPVLMSLELAADDPALPVELRDAAQAFRTQAAAGQPMPNSREANEVVWTVLSDMHTSALRRLLTPTQAVDSADAALRSRLGAP